MLDYSWFVPPPQIPSLPSLSCSDLRGWSPWATTLGHYTWPFPFLVQPMQGPAGDERAAGRNPWVLTSLPPPRLATVWECSGCISLRLHSPWPLLQAPALPGLQHCGAFGHRGWWRPPGLACPWRVTILRGFPERCPHRNRTFTKQTCL